MSGGRKFSKAQREHFLEGISGRCASDDRPVEEVIKRCYHGDTDAYIEDMLCYDPPTEKFLNLVAYRSTKTRAATEAAEPTAQ